MFSCDLCKFVSKQKGNLQVHIRTVHTKERNFACEFCKYRAGTKGILKTHVKNRHSHPLAASAASAAVKELERENKRLREKNLELERENRGSRNPLFWRFFNCCAADSQTNDDRAS